MSHTRKFLLTLPTLDLNLCPFQLFSEVFAEDPIFVCEVAQSLVNRASESKKGGRKSVKEKQKILTDVWSKLLEVRRKSESLGDCQTVKKLDDG